MIENLKRQRCQNAFVQPACQPASISSRQSGDLRRYNIVLTFSPGREIQIAHLFYIVTSCRGVLLPQQCGYGEQSKESVEGGFGSQSVSSNGLYGILELVEKYVATT